MKDLPVIITQKRKRSEPMIFQKLQNDKVSKQDSYQMVPKINFSVRVLKRPRPEDDDNEYILPQSKLIKIKSISVVGKSRNEKLRLADQNPSEFSASDGLLKEKVTLTVEDADHFRDKFR